MTAVAGRGTSRSTAAPVDASAAWRRGRPGVVALLPALLLTLLPAGCVYYNGLYNAQRLFDQAERLRLAGEDSLATPRYEDVLRKAADGYRRDPEGGWAADALLLLGKAHLRLGDPARARRALEAAREVGGPDVRRTSGVYLGGALLVEGRRDEALRQLNQALQARPDGPDLAEAHLLRARIFLGGGAVDAGWWDLDRAAAAHPRFAVPANLERIRWAIHHGDLNRAREGVRRLLADPSAGARRDTVLALVRRVSERWGVAEAADLLGRSSYGWGRQARGDALIVRAEILRAAGDTAEARRQAEVVAGGFGEAAAEARLLLARWRLADLRDLGGLDEVRRVLLPEEGHPEVDSLLSAMEEVATLAEQGLAEPLAWFAAGEVARDRLGAPVLARGLYLAYADSDPTGPWAAKALLAALAVSGEEGDRAWLRGRLESRAASPYVLAARGEPASGFEALEEELSRRLSAIRGR